MKIYLQRFLLILFLIPFFAIAQTIVPILEKTKSMKPYNGFFNFYWEESTGKIWLQIDKLDEEILYQTALPAGLGSNDVMEFEFQQMNNGLKKVFL